MDKRQDIFYDLYWAAFERTGNPYIIGEAVRYKYDSASKNVENGAKTTDKTMGR